MPHFNFTFFNYTFLCCVTFQTIIAQFNEKKLSSIKLICRHTHVCRLSLDWQRSSKLLVVGTQIAENVAHIAND